MAGSVGPVRRWLKRGALTAAALVILVGAPAAFILYPTFKSYPDPAFAAAASQAEQNQQDLAFLRQLPEVERSFTDQTRAAFERAVDELTAKAADLDRAGLAMGAARAVALADNGHTNVGGLVGGHSFNALPVRFGWFADGLFIIKASAEHTDLLGAEVLALDGRSPEELLQTLRAYVGGPPNLAKEFSPNFLISPELLHAAGLAGSPQALELRLRQGGSVEGSRQLVALPGSPEPLARNFWPKRDLSPVPGNGTDASWEHILDAATPPLYLSRPDQNFWHDYAEDVLFIQLNRMLDQDTALMADYLSGVVAEAAERKVKHVVVDLRFNPGGNYLLSADFAERLPEILPANGKIVILTSGNTFSAALTTAAQLKYHAGPRASLVGEPMGDRSQFWGEGGSATMPHSKLRIRYTTAYHDWENGCRLSEIRTCFFLNYVFGVPAGSLLPTVPVAQTFANYAAGDDAVLSEALKLVKQGD